MVLLYHILQMKGSYVVIRKLKRAIVVLVSLSVLLIGTSAFAAGKTISPLEFSPESSNVSFSLSTDKLWSGTFDITNSKTFQNAIENVKSIDVLVDAVPNDDVWSGTYETQLLEWLPWTSGWLKIKDKTNQRVQSTRWTWDGLSSSKTYCIKIVGSIKGAIYVYKNS